MEERPARQASSREEPLKNAVEPSGSRDDNARNNDQEALNSAWEPAEKTQNLVDVAKEGITVVSNPQNAQIE
jgi:hypothetical protein